MKPALFFYAFSRLIWLLLLVGGPPLLTAVNAAELAVTPNTKETKLSASQQEIFSFLKKEFPGELLSDEFRTLRNLSEHPRYLTYLSVTYAAENPFKKFEQFEQNVLPPKERYLKYFQAHLNVQNVDEITDEEHAIFHKMSEQLWKLDVQQLHGQEMNRAAMMPFLMKTLMNKEVQEWMVQRRIITQEHAGPQIGQFFLHLILFNLDIVIDDAEITKTLLETHGQNEGLIRLAIQKPLLFGRILSSFTDTDIFLKWTERRRVQ